MADYGEAVVKAVVQMLASCGVSEPSGKVSTASRKGASRALSDRVAALRLWLQDTHTGLFLHEWDAEQRIGLPEYVPSWSTCPLRSEELPTEWSAIWSCFHETHVAPILNEQRLSAGLSSGKRRHRAPSVDFNDLVELFSSPVVAPPDESPTITTPVESATEIVPVRVDSDLHVNGHVYAKGVCLAGADNAEMFE